MTSKPRRYLDKRADLARWPLVARDTQGVDAVVVIPVLAERDYLRRTLDSLAANAPEEVARTLVVCVVNNRESSHTEPERIAENLETLRDLNALAQSDGLPLRVAWIDASTPGREMPPKGGVGLARKIGLDAALDVLDRNGAGQGLLFSLDADAPVAPHYLETVRDYFASHGAWAAVVEYEHPLDEGQPETAAIVAYECYLRYHSLGLAFARSPYAYPAIGSTMVCRADAYAAVSGMNRRQGGEDFYFLQELAKTGGVHRIMGTRVYPASRPSTRVPLGTGRNVLAYLQGQGKRETLYHPESYRIVRDWLHGVGTHLQADADALMTLADSIAPPLAEFLRSNDFPVAWHRLQENARTTVRFLEQFHRWFDGFRTLMLLHHLRRSGYPEQEASTAIRTLLALRGDAVEVGTDRRALLMTLRDLDRRG